MKIPFVILFFLGVCLIQKSFAQETNSKVIDSIEETTEEAEDPKDSEPHSPTPQTKRRKPKERTGSKAKSRKNVSGETNLSQTQRLQSFFDFLESVSSEHILPLYVKLRKHEYFPYVFFTILLLKLLALLSSLLRGSVKKTLVISSESSGNSSSLQGMVEEINKGINDLKNTLKQENQTNTTTSEEKQDEMLSEVQSKISELSDVMSNFQNSILESQKDIIRDVVTIKKAMMASSTTWRSGKDNKTNSVISRKSSKSSIKECEKRSEKDPELSNKKEEKENHKALDFKEDSNKEVEFVHKEEFEEKKEIVEPVKVEKSLPIIRQPVPKMAIPQKKPILANAPQNIARPLFETEEVKKETESQDLMSAEQHKQGKPIVSADAEIKVDLLNQQIKTPFPSNIKPPTRVVPTPAVRRPAPLPQQMNTGQQGIGLREGQQKPAV